ncbi:MAG: DUF2059 domain-containing protein [Hyphomicrobiaceae bacterium]
MSILGRMTVIVALVAALAQPALAQHPARASDEARAAAKALIEASATSAQFDQMVPLLVRQMTQAFTSLAPDRAQEIREVMEKLSVRFLERKSELMDEVVRIYADLMTVEDMREVTKFYQSGPGRRMVMAMPEITRRSSSAGQIWGQMLGQEIAEEARSELKKRGIDL